MSMVDDNRVIGITLNKIVQHYHLECFYPYLVTIHYVIYFESEIIMCKLDIFWQKITVRFENHSNLNIGAVKTYNVSVSF